MTRSTATVPEIKPGIEFEPGQWVRHPHRPDWGLGQVQSVVGSRVTVNFQHAGKVLINAALVALDCCAGRDVIS